MRVATLVLTISVAVPLAAQQSEPCTAHWTGAIELPAGKLAFTADLAKQPDGACGGTISIPQQNAVNVPLLSVVARADSVSFVISGVPGTPTFAGARSPKGARISPSP